MNTPLLMNASVALSAPPDASVQHTLFWVNVTLASVAVMAAMPPPCRSLMPPLPERVVFVANTSASPSTAPPAAA